MKEKDLKNRNDVCPIIGFELGIRREIRQPTVGTHTHIVKRFHK